MNMNLPFDKFQLKMLLLLFLGPKCWQQRDHSTWCTDENASDISTNITTVCEQTG